MAVKSSEMPVISIAMIWNLELTWPRWPYPLARLIHRIQAHRSKAAPAATEAFWHRDPLSHPALQAMSQRELGDLPFDPGRVARD